MNAQDPKEPNRRRFRITSGHKLKYFLIDNDFSSVNVTLYSAAEKIFLHLNLGSRY
jgi:hypothetical protein